VQQSCCDRAEDGYLLEIQASSLTAALLLLDIFLEILVITFLPTVATACCSQDASSDYLCAGR
jgi:hypothetical protein